MVTTTKEFEPDDARLAATIALREESRDAMSRARFAYDQLYHRHSSRLLAFLASRVEKHDLDDVHQEVWLRAWKALPTRFDGKDFRAWIFEIARNLILDRHRRKKPERLVDDEPIADRKSVSSEEYLLERERREILSRCVDRLPPEVASVFRARLSGLDYDEICRAGSMTPNKAQKLQHQAKKLIKSCVEAALA
ncbi:RNA polymerase sigma factor [Singulisphaera sp. PoT]|uniref:RNA polymerase sigma factor n=1 Tax=Singulisphaera sp. PoT TaxID=3411797 RepID=UPI003BF5FC84